MVTWRCRARRQYRSTRGAGRRDGSPRATRTPGACWARHDARTYGPEMSGSRKRRHGWQGRWVIIRVPPSSQTAKPPSPYTRYSRWYRNLFTPRPPRPPHPPRLHTRGIRWAKTSRKARAIPTARTLLTVVSLPYGVLADPSALVLLSRTIREPSSASSSRPIDSAASGGSMRRAPLLPAADGQWSTHRGGHRLVLPAERDRQPRRRRRWRTRTVVPPLPTPGASPALRTLVGWDEAMGAGRVPRAGSATGTV